MRYFLDTEFIESGPLQPIYLISIGLVAEDNRELYIQNYDCPFPMANDWVIENVYPYLTAFDISTLRPYGMTYQEEIDRWTHFKDIAKYIVDFIGSDPSPEFWTYYGAYDWVVFCQIFGSMVNLPRGYERCSECKSPKSEFTSENHRLHSHADYYLCKEHDGYYELETVGQFPMFSLDLQAFLYLNKIDNITDLIPIEGEHNALMDARWNKKVYDWLSKEFNTN